MDKNKYGFEEILMSKEFTKAEKDFIGNFEKKEYTIEEIKKNLKKIMEKEIS